MKKIFKFMPVAMGLLALASCSNNDFFSTETAQPVDLSDKIVVNVIDEDEAAGTRAFRDANQKVAYEEGEILRVYDSKLQAYDEFEFSAAAKTFILPADQSKAYVDKREDGKFDYAYALFGSPADANNISYAGWKGGYNVALLNIESTFGYKEDVQNTATGENQVVYKATLPQWGTVTPVVSEVTRTAKSFTTSLRYLTGRAKVVFENGKATGVKSVKVSSIRFATAADVTAGKKSIKAGGTTDAVAPTDVQKTAALAAMIRNAEFSATDNAKYFVANTDKPLAGWFEAVLDKKLENDGIRQIEDETSVAPAAGTSITINVANVDLMDDLTNVFFFPIVPATYDMLLFEYNTTADADYKVIAKKTGAVARGEKIEGDDFTVKKPVEMDKDGVLTTLALTNFMKTNATNGISVALNINGTSGDNISTSADDETLNTIFIPQLKNDMIVNIKSNATALAGAPLTIKDAAGADNSKYSVTFNFTGFAPTSNYITVNSTAKVILAGDYSKINTTVTGKSDINVTSTSGLTLGIAATTPITIKAGKVNVAAGTVAVDGTGSTVTALTSATKTTVSGGTVTTLTANDVVIAGGTVTTLQLADANAAVDMTSGTLVNFNKHSAALTADRTVTVTTSGDAVITATTPENWNFAEDGVKVYKYSFKATYDDETVTGTAATAQAAIYTAAQLKAATAAVTGNVYTLMTDVEFDLDEQNFASIALNAATTTFDGNEKTIEGLPAALFTTLTNGLTVKDLTLKDANVEPDLKTVDGSGFGVVANTVAAGATATLNNVVVSNAILGRAAGKSGSKSHSYGLLVGYLAGTLDVIDCGVSGTVQGYYNLGGYVGNLAGGTLTINKTAANLAQNMSSVKFVKSFTTSETEDENAGKIGNFIGSVTAASKFILGSAAADGANAFAKFFSSNQITATQIANAEKKVVGTTTKSYVGMPNKEIGLSLATGLTFGTTTSQLYGKYQTADTTPVTYTMDNTVNIYE